MRRHPFANLSTDMRYHGTRMGEDRTLFSLLLSSRFLSSPLLLSPYRLDAMGCSIAPLPFQCSGIVWTICIPERRKKEDGEEQGEQVGEDDTEDDMDIG